MLVVVLAGLYDVADVGEVGSGQISATLDPSMNATISVPSVDFYAKLRPGLL